MNSTALEDLRSLLYSEKEWIKVHVAEYLIWENLLVKEVREEFLKENEASGHVPKYRIGIWRVLAQATVDKGDRQQWIDKIVAAYQDPEGEDRLHAIETLAKLEIHVVRELPEDVTGSFRLYSMWNYAVSSEGAKRIVKRKLIDDLVEGELTESEMQVISFILRYIGPLSHEEFNSMLQWIQTKHVKPSLYSNLLATLLIASPAKENPYLLDCLKRELLALRARPEALNNIMKALAEEGDANDKADMLFLYEKAKDVAHNEYNSDLHATACYMVLKAEVK